jgi:hypothetical protein
VAYRLTDASALGLDLARTRGGVDAAGVLLRLLLAGPSDVRRPARARADLTVARVRAHELLGPSAPTVVDLTAIEDAVEARRDRPDDEQGRAGRGDGDDGPDDDAVLRRLRRVSRRLGAVSFGTVADLLALGARLADELSGGDRRPRPGPGRGRRGRPARCAPPRPGRGGSAGPGALPRAPHGPAPPRPARAAGAAASGRALLAAGPSPLVAGAAGLLGRVAAANPEQLLLPHRPAPHVWAEHMHSLAWAVEVTGRTRLAAAAQLELLRCLDAAGVSGGAFLGGVWNACSAAVQAQVVTDVLPADTHEVLVADLLAALPG